MTEPAGIFGRDARVRRRMRGEIRFRVYGIASIGIALAALGWLFVSLALGSAGTFRATHILLDIHFDAALLDPEGTGDPDVTAGSDFQPLARNALRAIFPEVRDRRERRALNGLVTSGAPFLLRDMVLEDSSVLGRTVPVWLPASDEADLIVTDAAPDAPPGARRTKTERQAAWLAVLADEGRVKQAINWRFLTGGDSREPELAGILVALMGSIFSVLVCVAVSFPVGVLAAIYLQEFARPSRLTTLFEVNINNLAAVPSIIFGLFGLFFFLNVLGLPRSAPLVGGLVLALMTLPTIIIASRASLHAVPEAIREGALAIGASKIQAVFHHVVPLALPGMMTGTILGMARALGETAPLLMIGMVAFIIDVPKSILDPATALPVQIFLWADSPERAFADKTAAAILVLLVFLVVMNAGAIFIRSRFETRL